MLSRRLFICGLTSGLLGGCLPRSRSSGRLELMWGRRGISDGRLNKPRALTIDGRDRLYIVDMTGRIQVFTTEGQFLHAWRTPRIEAGKPCGLSFARDGHLLVADTHYHRVLVYTPDGQLCPARTLGGTAGLEPGQFGFVTDAVQDSQGNYYVAEYGQLDRIQKFSADGQFRCQWGGHGQRPSEFLRPQSLQIDDQDHLWVADACNHRIQVFDATDDQPRLVKIWGEAGRQLGQLRYPYGLLLDERRQVYVCEFGNHRVQKFTLDGQPQAAWGTNGRRRGELDQPWAIAQDRQGRIHVLDTYNHRVQRIVL